MGVSAREIQETQTMHFRKDVFPLLSDISYGKCPDGKPRKIYTHLLAEVRTPKDPLFSLAGIKMSLERAYQLYGPKKNLYVQSDGAESQFWSAEMFYTLPRFFNSLDDRFDFETVVWFKTVSGHGKGEIDSSHGCVKRDLTNLYNNLGRNDLNGDGLDVIGLVDSADGLVNYLNNDMKCHFGELESEKMDSRGFYLSGRYISEFKRDPGLRTSGKTVTGSRSGRLHNEDLSKLKKKESYKPEKVSYASSLQGREWKMGRNKNSIQKTPDRYLL